MRARRAMRAGRAWPGAFLPFLLMLAMFHIVLHVAPAAAQTAPPPGQAALSEQLRKWDVALNAAAEVLRTPDITIKALDELQGKLSDLVREVRSRLKPAQDTRRRWLELSKALGPAPRAGETEDAETAARRKQIGERLTVAERRFRLLDLVQKRADGLLDRVSDRRTELLTRRLLRTGPSLWDGDTWRRAAGDVAGSLTQMAGAVGVWLNEPAIGEWYRSAGLVDSVLFLLLAIAVVWWLRWWLYRRTGRAEAVEAPPRVTKLIGVLIALLNSGVAPAALVLFVWFLLDADEVLVGLFGDMLAGGAMGLALIFAVRGGARAGLAPWQASWRVIGIGDRGARRAFALILAAALLLAADMFIERALYRLYLGREFDAVAALIVNGGLALILILIGSRRLWWRGAPEDSAWREPKLARFLRFLARLAGIVALAAHLLSYHEMAGFLAQGCALSGLVLGGAWLIRYVVSELADHLLMSTSAHAAAFRRGAGLAAGGAPRLRLWLVLLFDVVLAMAVLFLLALIWGSSSQLFFATLRQAWDGVSIGNVRISLGDILIAILVFIALVFAVRGVQHQFEERIGKQTRMDIGVRRALHAGIGYAGIIIAAAVGISLAGFDLSNLAIIAGALSVGIGFGLQAIVNNFVSGIILFVERPVKEGDWVVVDKYEGYIKRIGVRATEITTLQNASVIMPNSKLISEPVQNWVHKDQTGRIDIDVGVAYGSDTELVQKILLDCADAHEDVLKTPKPAAWFMKFGDSSLDFQLRIYVKNIRELYRISSDMRFAIDKAFRVHGVTIPFPQRDLHVKEWPREGQPAAAPDKPGG